MIKIVALLKRRPDLTCAAAALDCMDIAVAHWADSGGEDDLGMLLAEGFDTLASLHAEPAAR